MLRQHDVRLIVGAVGISALGDFLLWVPLTLHLQQTTWSGVVVAALLICLWGRSSCSPLSLGSSPTASRHGAS